MNAVKNSETSALKNKPFLKRIWVGGQHVAIKEIWHLQHPHEIKGSKSEKKKKSREDISNYSCYVYFMNESTAHYTSKTFLIRDLLIFNIQ